MSSGSIRPLKLKTTFPFAALWFLSMVPPGLRCPLCTVTLRIGATCRALLSNLPHRPVLAVRRRLLHSKPEDLSFPSAHRFFPKKERCRRRSHDYDLRASSRAL